MTTRSYAGSPAMLPLYAKAVAPAVPVLGRLPGVRRGSRELPDLELVQPGVRIDRERLAEYAEVCGFGLRETLPATYPHILAFPLHMALMTDGEFPFAPMGIVHIANTITQLRAIGAGETLELRVRADDLRPHPKGRQFDLVTEATVDDSLVWRGVSTMLRRGGGGEPGGDAAGAREPERPAPTGATRWRLGGDLGRRYAAVSGDRNPIHLYGVTAKAFGFPRQIAHGMWSKARCVAELQPGLPDAFEVQVAFKRPILLPATVSFGARQDGKDTVFALTDARKGTPHALGSAHPV